MKPTLLVLAAGMGSRYGGLKQLDGVGPNNETIIDYSIYDAIRAGYGKIVFIIRRDIEKDFKEVFVDKLKDKIQVEYVFQELENVPSGVKVNKDRVKPWGTGHAVLVAKDAIKEPFAVINADDFYGKEAFQDMHDYLVNLPTMAKEKYSMVGYRLQNTLSDHGYVSRGVCEVSEDQELQGVVERTRIEKIDGKIVYQDENQRSIELTGNEVVSMNFWGFGPSFFQHLETNFEQFIKENYDQLKAEFYIPTVVNKLRQENKVQTLTLPSNAKWFGVTYSEDKPIVVKKIKSLIEEGIYPQKMW